MRSVPLGDREIPPPEASPPPAPAPASGPSPSGRVRSGSFTALLQQLASVDDEDYGSGWFRALTPGAVVGRFEMIRELGRGGFGVVWEARDQKLGRNIAFKAVRAGGRAKVREERLLREAEAAARLSHPNIVTIHDVGQAEQGPYLVLELLEGETLADRLARGPLRVGEAIHVAVEIAKGVAHAHARGVVHRDLKPANVVLCPDGRVKVLDFGMAQAFGQRRDEGGTPAYMAPEQWAGAPEDERSDVYALGVMLFEMATGELPFPIEDGGKTVRSPTRAPALEVREAPALGDLVARMLEKDPTRRPRECGEVLDALSEIEHALAGVAATPVATVRRHRRRSSWLVLGGVAAGALAGVALTALTLRGQGPLGLEQDERTLVAVADFANETHDPDLDGLSGLLITSLEQSKSFRVLTRGRMLDLVRELGQGDVPRIDESVARAVGQRAGVNTLLIASIQKLGDTYAAELRALDPRKDEYLFTVREQAHRKNDLLPLIDRMSERTRLALREPDADVKASGVSVAEAVTGNLEAYRHYFRGKELASRWAMREALAEYRQAVALEPGFVLAQAEATWIAHSDGAITPSAARQVLRDVAPLAARAPEKEGGLVRVLAAYFDGRFADARREILSLAARFPEDAELAVPSAAILAWSGYVEDALVVSERALRLAPEWDYLRLDQVGLLATVGRAKEAVQRNEAAARQRGTPTARVALGLARYAAGDAAGGVEALRAVGDEHVLGRIFLAEGLAGQGRFDEALAAVARYDDDLGDTTRAQVFAHAGRFREGLAALDAAARRPGADVEFARQARARYLAAAGDAKRAREAVSPSDFFLALDGVFLATSGDARFPGYLRELEAGASFQARFLRALAAHRAGDRKTALAELRALDGDTVSFVPYFRGLVAAEAGLDEEAVEAFRRFEGRVYYASEGYEAAWFLARARLLTARALDRLGRRDEARRVAELQLARWKAADADLPLLKELKALRKELGPPAPAR